MNRCCSPAVDMEQDDCDSQTCNVYVTSEPLIHQFANLTTCHGPRLIAQSPTLSSKLLWSAVVVGLLAALTCGIVGLAEDFLSYPTYMAMNTKTVSGLEFPAVTFCGFNRLNDTALGEVARTFNVDKNRLWQYLIVGLGQIVSGSKGEMSDLRRTLAFVENKLSVANTSFHDSLFATLFDIGEMIGFNDADRCSWDTAERQQPCRRDWFDEIVTFNGNCFTFNLLSNFTQVSTGPNGGLSIAINICDSLNSERPGNVVPARMAVGGKVFIHEPGFPIGVNENFMAVSAGKIAFINLGVRNMSFLTPPHGKCGQRPLRYFNNTQYKRQMCLIECGIEFALHECGCLPIVVSGLKIEGVEICSPLAMLECFSNVTHRKLYDTTQPGIECPKDCPLSCHERDYSASMSYVDFPSVRFKLYYEQLFRSNEDDIRENMVILHLFFGKLLYTEKVQMRDTTTWNFVANIGGQMGLTVGASLVTVCELIVYLSVRVYSCAFPARKETLSAASASSDAHKQKHNNEPSTLSVYL